MGKIKHATFYDVCISSILLFPICMKIQQLIVSVVTRHLQLVMGQKAQHQRTHLLQLAMVYRPARPQLQVSLYMSHMPVVSV